MEWDERCYHFFLFFREWDEWGDDGRNGKGKGEKELEDVHDSMCLVIPNCLVITSCLVDVVIGSGNGDLGFWKGYDGYDERGYGSP